MNPNDFGKKFLAEKCQKISISKILRKSKYEIKLHIINSYLEHEGIKINFTTSKTGFGGTRIWFECPSCKARVGTIYKSLSIIGCRNCLNLDYKKHRFKGMIETQ